MGRHEDTTNWKIEIEEAVQGSDKMPIIACTLDEFELVLRFNDGFGGAVG